MNKFLSKLGMKSSAFAAALLMSGAMAETAEAANTIVTMADSTGTQVASFPKLISAACYVGGAAFIGTGVMKVKGHVDNPGQTPLREGLVRLGAGGVLVAAPALTAVMVSSTAVGSGNQAFSGFSFSSY